MTTPNDPLFVKPTLPRGCINLTSTAKFLSLARHIPPGQIVTILTNLLPNHSRNRLVVRTPRCGRGNPGSNPGCGILRGFSHTVGVLGLHI